MHRRIIPWALVVLLVLLLAACGAPGSPPTGTEPAAAESEAAQTSARTAEGDLALPEQRTGSQDAPGLPADEPQSAAQDASPSASEPTPTPTQTAGKYGPLFQQYVRGPVSDGAYTISMKQSGVTLVTAVSGKNSALDSNMADVLHITLINKDGKYYMLVHGTKKYAEMTEADYAKQADSLEMASLDLSNVQYTESGTQTVGGRQYSTETYDEGTRGSVTYYFTGEGLARARVMKDGKTSDVESFTIRDEADMSLFTIPSDFTLVSDPSLLFTQ